MLKAPTLRKPKAVLTAMYGVTEFAGEDVRRVLTRVSPRHAEEAWRQIERGTAPLLGTLVRLLEADAAADSDRRFVEQAYEKLVTQRASEEKLARYEEGLASGFVSRAEVVQDLITSREFREMLGHKPRQPELELASLSRIEALLIDQVRTAIRPRRLQPPVHMRWRVGEPPWDVYGRHFELMGRHFQAKLERDAGLNSASRVLDIGSGCGRLAIPLTEVIGAEGAYVGLEIVPSMVRWCQRNISVRFPNFRFVRCAVQNSNYNPREPQRAEQYQFPFENEQFDLVIATSVFTHLRPASAQNYIVQSARVLRPGGKLFITAFLAGNGNRPANCAFQFEHPLDGVALTTSPNNPEKAVAYPVEWLLAEMRRAKLELAQPVKRGAWTGENPAYSGQDVLILEKKS